MPSSTQQMFPKITQQGLDDLRRRIGVPITDTLEPWCHEATRDNIRHYAHGIGDDNPLWCDPAYAARTRFRGIVAPPSFLFATSRIISGYVGGLAGVHAMWAGADWTWHQPTRRNDEISTEAWLKDLIEHETRFAGRAVQQIYHVTFRNQNGDLLAEADSWCFRTERDHAREQGRKYTEVKARAPRRYSDEELAEVYRLYAQEEIRGATPRYWQDVTVGEALPKMAKAATAEDLQEAFTSHFEETERQVERLEQVFDVLSERPRGKKCDGIMGILEEGVAFKAAA